MGGKKMGSLIAFFLPPIFLPVKTAPELAELFEGQKGRGRKEFRALGTSAPPPLCGENERPKRRLELGC